MYLRLDAHIYTHLANFPCVCDDIPESCQKERKMHAHLSPLGKSSVRLWPLCVWIRVGGGVTVGTWPR